VKWEDIQPAPAPLDEQYGAPIPVRSPAEAEEERRRQERQRPLPLIPDFAQEDLEPYSVRRALLSGEEKRAAGYELEVSNAIERAIGRKPEGIYVPLALPISQRAGLDSKTTSAGLELKFIEPGTLIDLLRVKATVFRLGAQQATGLQGNVAYPRLTGAAVGSWQAENPGADVSDTNLTTDRMTLSPKMFMATSSYSVNLLKQATPSVEMAVRMDLAMIVAIAIDAAAIAGTGVSNQPTGILSQSGVGSVTLGANGAIPKWDDLTAIEETLALANADVGALGWVTTPSIRRRLRKVSKLDFAAAGDPAWQDGRLLDYPAEATNAVPSNLTKGTSTTICHAIIFGNWQDLIVAGWGANYVDIVVDPFTKKKQNMIEITSYTGVDIGLRHPASFVKVTDALK
jgi:HK97 family phage major capsid protein